MVSEAGAASVLAALITAVFIVPAPEASAFCDTADCVPNVARNVVPGGPCDPQHLFDFGLDSNSHPFVCSTAGLWAAAGPLVGVTEIALPCQVLNGSAQQPDGSGLKCAQVNDSLRWVYRDDMPG